MTLREAVILVGGLGTRLRPAVPGLPKPMAPLVGRPFLEYLLEFWTGQGIGHFVLAVGYRGEAIRRHFGARFGEAVLSYCDEENPLGTGGALGRAVAQTDSNDSTLVLNGDTFLEIDGEDLQRFHHAHEADVTIAVTPSEGGNVGLGETGKVIRFGEGAWVNGGVYVLGPRAKVRLRARPAPFSLEDDFFRRLPDGDLQAWGFVSKAPFLDIGTPERYRKAERFFRERHA